MASSCMPWESMAIGYARATTVRPSGVRIRSRRVS